MSTQVQYRRGTAAQNDAFTGALAEITVDTTNKVLRVHDGVTTGGFALAGLAASQTLSNKVYQGTSLSVTGNVTATGATINGDLTVTGNATLSGNIVGDRIQNGTTLIDIENANGNANITVGGTTNVAVFATTGVFVTGLISATGNITGNYILGNGSQLTGIDATSIQSGTSNVRVVSSGGNVAAGIGGTSNVLVIASTGTFVTGAVSATGNITGSFILGNGSQLTGIDATSIQSGTSNVRVVSSGGNVAAGIGGTSNVLVVASTGTFVTGIVSATGAITTGGDISITGNIVDAAALTISTSSNGNITLSPNGTGVIIASKDLLNGQANGVGNIGNATGYFNTVFAKATSAQYADVAEKYVADRQYPPGTILEIGGAAEVQETTTYASTRIAGVVSTTPALLMNSGETDANSVEIALLGRVPCRVTGTIHRGDLLTSSDRPGVATALRAADYRPGCVIGKALEAHATAGDGIIEVLVGRL